MKKKFNRLLLTFIHTTNFIQHVFNEQERRKERHTAERIKMAGSYGIRRVCRESKKEIFSIFALWHLLILRWKSIKNISCCVGG